MKQAWLQQVFDLLNNLFSVIRLIAYLSSLSVESGDRGGVDDDSSLSVRVLLVLSHQSDSVSDHVESSQHVYLQKIGISFTVGA